MTTVRVVDEPHAPESLRQLVRDRLNLYNVAATGLAEYAPVSIFLKTATDEIVGGILGSIWGGWLHVTFLWVSEPLRGRGYGRTLLEAAERRAIERGCGSAYLDTFSFQAPEFYKKAGYRVCGTIEGYPPGHAHYTLSKRLADGEGEPGRGAIPTR